MQKFHSLVIKEISKATPKAYSLVFYIPSEMRKSFVFKSGQYITIKHSIDDKEIRRCYSISSVPSKTDTFEIIVKCVQGGVFSQYVEQKLKIGDTLEIAEPEGNFYYEETAGSSKNFVAVAAGSGITPIFSIIQSILTHSNDNIVLFYGNKSVEQTIFHNEILELSENFGNRFKIIRFYTEENIDGHHFGRINQKVILDTLLKNHIDLSNIEKFYVCGPEDLISSTTSSFLSQNIKKENILHELFYSQQSPEQIINSSSIIAGETVVKLILDGDESMIKVNKNVLLLDSILDAGFDIPYSCQNAICSACLCMLTKGQVNMVKNEVLSEEEIRDGKIVVCQSYPVSDEIELNYDKI
ncbi:MULTISPECIES: ferredoxin--NADP reductase [Chryseobacterium]|nr:ferredoxin--NADP reductase [Chryseobacterium piscicola]PQA90519.1 hypothetical protein B0A70_14440 [Chryseobacterium piscicola]